MMKWEVPMDMDIAHHLVKRVNLWVQAEIKGQVRA